MRACSSTALLLALLWTTPGITSATEPVPAWVSDARQAASALAGQLIPALQRALSEGGPQQAVEVCQVRAPEIANAVSGERMDVGRTALRVRSTRNAPDRWEESVLRDFERQLANGAAPSSLEAWTTTQASGQKLGRWVKAIPTAPQCTTCHGVDIDPDLASTIDELYPDDQATGFQTGELRGAFTISVRLDHE